MVPDATYSGLAFVTFLVTKLPRFPVGFKRYLLTTEKTALTLGFTSLPSLELDVDHGALLSVRSQILLECRTHAPGSDVRKLDVAEKIKGLKIVLSLLNMHNHAKR